jgi:hypothetical protein
MPGPWIVYNNARRRLMDATIDLDADTFYMSLYMDASNAPDVTQVMVSELSDEVAPGTGYTTGGQQLQNVTWDIGAYDAEMRFSADTVRWDAAGGDIVGIRYAVIWRKGATTYDDLLVLVSDLASITVANGNPITVGPNVGGLFELN